MWIAKNKDTGYEYPKAFSDIYDCQKYIDTELKEDLKKANGDYVKSFLCKHLFPPVFYCNRILCYNKSQNRFAEGLDF